MPGHRIFFGLLLILGLVGSANAQQSWKEQDLKNISVYLMQKVSDSSFRGGTGTLIRHKSRLYLLTAAHIAEGLRRDAKLIVRNSNDRTLVFDLNYIARDPRLRWQAHPVADLALLRLRRFRNFEIQFVGKWFLPSERISRDPSLLKSGLPLSYFGYPSLEAKLENFKALKFDSSLSSGPRPGLRFDSGQRHRFFYLEDPSYKGCSGAAVYSGIDGNSDFYLQGVIHGTGREARGDRKGVVTPAHYIWELLEGR
jgi:hypothetical protein